MPYSLVRSTVAGIFGEGVKTELPSGVLPLWDDLEKEEILAGMLEFSQWGLAGRDDHGPQAGITRRTKLPSSPEEEEEVEYESVKGDDDRVGGDSLGSEDDDDDDGDGNKEVAEADDNGDDEEEEGTEGRSARASPLPNRSDAPNLEVATPSLPGPIDEDDAVPLDV